MATGAKTGVTTAGGTGGARGMKPSEVIPPPPEGTKCHNCGTVTTPLWRRSVEGHPICNACGLYFKMRKVERPRSLEKGIVRQKITKDVRCSNCATDSTSLWRRSLGNGLTVCNACGLYEKLHGKDRPVALKGKQIRKRNRFPTQGGSNPSPNSAGEGDGLAISAASSAANSDGEEEAAGKKRGKNARQGSAMKGVKGRNRRKGGNGEDAHELHGRGGGDLDDEDQDDEDDDDDTGEDAHGNRRSNCGFGGHRGRVNGTRHDAREDEDNDDDEDEDDEDTDFHPSPSHQRRQQHQTPQQSSSPLSNHTVASAVIATAAASLSQFQVPNPKQTANNARQASQKRRSAPAASAAPAQVLSPELAATQPPSSLSKRARLSPGLDEDTTTPAPTATSFQAKSAPFPSPSPLLSAQHLESPALFSTSPMLESPLSLPSVSPYLLPSPTLQGTASRGSLAQGKFLHSSASDSQQSSSSSQSASSSLMVPLSLPQARQGESSFATATNTGNLTVANSGGDNGSVVPRKLGPSSKSTVSKEEQLDVANLLVNIRSFVSPGLSPALGPSPAHSPMVHPMFSISPGMSGIPSDSVVPYTPNFSMPPSMYSPPFPSLYISGASPFLSSEKLLSPKMEPRVSNLPSPALSPKFHMEKEDLGSQKDLLNLMRLPEPARSGPAASSTSTFQHSQAPPKRPMTVSHLMTE